MKQHRLMFLIVALFWGLPCEAWAQAPGVTVFDDDEMFEKITENGKKLLESQKLVHLSTLVKQLSKPKCALKLEPPRSTRLEAKDVYEIARKGTLSVGLLAQEEATGQWYFNAATGFVVTADGVVATSYHVLEHDEESLTVPQSPITIEKADSKPGAAEKAGRNEDAYLIAADFEGHVYPVLEVLAADKVSDTCLLRIEGTGLFPLAFNVNSRPGETVFCFSNPSDMFGHFSQGIIARFFKIREIQETPEKHARPVTFLSISADFAVGSSGGPILDDRGNIVGQVQSTSSIFADPEAEHPQHPQMVIKAALAAREILALIDQTGSESAIPDPVASTAEIPEDLPPGEPALGVETPDMPANSHETVVPVSRHGSTRTALHFQRIQHDYESAATSLLPRLEEARTDLELRGLQVQVDRLVRRTESRCFHLAAAHPSHADVIPVLEYLVLHSEIHRIWAFQQLSKYHTGAAEIGKTCVFLNQKPQNSAGASETRQLETLVREVIRTNCHREAVGLASLVLAELHAERLESGQSRLDQTARREVEALFLKVIRQFSDVRVPSPREPDGLVMLTDAGSVAAKALKKLCAATRQEIESTLKSRLFIDRNAPANSELTFRLR